MNGLLLARVARDSGPTPSWSRDAVPSRPFAHSHPSHLGRDARFVLHGEGASALYELPGEYHHQLVTTHHHNPTQPNTTRRTQ